MNIAYISSNKGIMQEIILDAPILYESNYLDYALEELQ